MAGIQIFCWIERSNLVESILKQSGDYVPSRFQIAFSRPTVKVVFNETHSICTEHFEREIKKKAY